MKEPTNYSVVAQFYDEAYGQESDSSDILFYLEAAKKSSGPVLEIACGTGRILLPIANSGIEIDGIDISEAMLSVLKGKLRQEAKLTYFPKLLQADMRAFSTGKSYQLVTIPFRSLQHLITLEDKLRALTAAKSHLAAEGRLVFDVAFPKFDVIAQGAGQEYLDSTWVSPKTGQPVEMYFFRKDYRKADQTVLGS